MLTLHDVTLGWERLKLDRPRRVFVHHPHLLSWIERNLNDWLNEIVARAAGDLTPHPCQICKVPKVGGLVRPGGVLDLQDEVIYNAILSRCHPEIWRVLGPTQGRYDLAYQLQPPSDGTRWIRTGLQVWRSFREKSIEELDRGSQYVLFTDVTAFYENIDLDRLGSDIRDLGVDHRLLDLLMNCLRRWSLPRGRGIPQGYSASDILAKLFMFNVDSNLVSAGFRHLRYVDDMRIFSETSTVAKRALLFLGDLLRD